MTEQEKERLKKFTEITDVNFDIEGSHLAVTHELQGYSANGYHDSLIMKSAFDYDKVTDLNLMKALEQVTITTSFEEMLRSFFNMWGRDAAVLTSLLGFKTEVEDELENSDMSDDDPWELNYAAACLQGIEDQAQKFDIIKKAANNQIDELSLDERKALYNLHFAIQNIDEHDLFQKAMKTEQGTKMKSSAYAYVPDKTKPSTWKLRIDDAAHTRAAVAALGKGFRGNKVQIPEADQAAVKKKVRAAYKKYFPDNPVPEVLKLSTKPFNIEGAKPSVKSTLDNKNNIEDLVDNNIANDKDELDPKTPVAPTKEKEPVVKAAELEEVRKAMQDIIKQNEELIKAKNDAIAEKEAMIKAHEQEKFEKAVSDKCDVLVKLNLNTLSEDEQLELATTLVKAESDSLILKAFNELNDRAEKMKEEFSHEVGHDGVVAKAAEDAPIDFNTVMLEKLKKSKNK